MKHSCVSLLAIVALFSISPAFADFEGAPFSPESDARFNKLEEGFFEATPAANGHHVKQVVQATYDFAKQTGQTGTYDLGVGLPANAMIVRSYLYSVTKPTTSASGTLSFYCKDSASGGNILSPTAAASYGSTGAAIDGIQTGTAANFSTVTAACNIKAVVATGALTAGKVTAILEYVTHQ